MSILTAEFGDRVTRVCVASYNKKRKWECGSAYAFETPEGLVTDGVISDPDALGSWLAGELARKGVKASGAVFSITSSRVAVRFVNLPPVRKSKIKGLIAANADEYFPGDVKEYLVEHVVFEYPPKKTPPGETANAPRVRAGVYAAPLTLLDGYVRTAKAAGLKLRSMDYSGNGRYRVYASAPQSGVTMYLYADLGFTCLTYMRGDVLLLQRTLNFGPDDLVYEYIAAEEGNLTPDEALARLTDPKNAERVYALLGERGTESALSRLAGGVRRTQNQFDSNFGLEIVGRTTLAGPCARMVGLREMLAGATDDREILLLEDLPDLNRAVAEHGAHIDCLGALAGPKSFLPGEHKAQERRRRREQFEYKQNMVTVISVAVSALLLMGAVACPAVVKFMLDAANAEKAETEEQIASLYYAEEAYNTMTALEAGVASLASLRESLVSPNDELVAFLEEMEAKMPSEIIVMSMSCSKESVSMNVTVPTKVDAARVLVKFREFESLQSIAISSVSAGGVAGVSFSLVCAYVVPEEEEEDSDLNEEEEDAAALAGGE